jgi:hypothetical protein
MRLTKLPTGFNWKYAIGEVILIVVGITIALAANSWYEGQRERSDEIRLLQQMHQTLTEDLEELERRSVTMHQAAQDIAALLNHLEADRPYSDEFGGFIRSLIRFRGVRIRMAPFEALKARGLDLLSNDTLRMKLISFYEDDFARLEFSTANNLVFVQDLIEPYVMANFRQVASRDWVPNDYDQLKSDGYLVNLCRRRLFGLQDFVLPYFDETTESIREILVAIEQELDKG